MYGVHPSFKIKRGEQQPSPRLQLKTLHDICGKRLKRLRMSMGAVKNVEHPVAQENQILTLSTKSCTEDGTRIGVSLFGEKVAKLANGARDFLHWRAAKTQDEAGPRHPAQIGERKRPDPKLLAGGSLGNLHIQTPIWQRHSQMHASLVPEHLDLRLEVLRYAVD